MESFRQINIKRAQIQKEAFVDNLQKSLAGEFNISDNDMNLEKALDLTHGGKLVPKHIVDAKGHKRLVYVLPDQISNHHVPLAAGDKFKTKNGEEHELVREKGHDGKGGHLVTLKNKEGKIHDKYIHNLEAIDSEGELNRKVDSMALIDAKRNDEDEHLRKLKIPTHTILGYEIQRPPEIKMEGVPRSERVYMEMISKKSNEDLLESIEGQRRVIDRGGSDDKIFLIGKLYGFTEKQIFGEKGTDIVDNLLNLLRGGNETKQTISKVMEDFSSRKEEEWTQVNTISPEEQEKIQPEIDKLMMLHISKELKDVKLSDETKDKIFVANVNGEKYLVDPQGYDHPRYTLKLNEKKESVDSNTKDVSGKTVREVRSILFNLAQGGDSDLKIKVEVEGQGGKYKTNMHDLRRNLFAENRQDVDAGINKITILGGEEENKEIKPNSIFNSRKIKDIHSGFIGDKFKTNLVGGEEYDFFKEASLEDKAKLFQYLGFADDKKFTEEEEKTLFNANIANYVKDNGVAQAFKRRSLGKTLSLKQWAKQEGRDVNHVGVEKDYKLYLNRRNPDIKKSVQDAFQSIGVK